MSPGGPAADDLRKRFVAAAERSRPAPGCPGLESFWEAQQGELSAARTRELIEHTVHCPACAEGWRVAHAMGAMEQEPAQRQASSGRWIMAAAAAAVLAVMIGLTTLVPTALRDAQPVYRAGPSEIIRSLTPEEVPLPRSDFVLRWSPGPEGTLYAVRLTTASFSPVALIDGLERSEWRVESKQLERIESGTRLLWRVEALLPDGRRVQSETHFITLE